MPAGTLCNSPPTKFSKLAQEAAEQRWNAQQAAEGSHTALCAAASPRVAPEQSVPCRTHVAMPAQGWHPHSSGAMENAGSAPRVEAGVVLNNPSFTARELGAITL